jgi:hypothetical protein
MQQALPWILASVALALLVGAGVLWLFSQRRGAVKPLPTEWGLAARPVFNSDERRVYRQLREALPHHIVLSKLPMVRFCQPTDPSEVRFWYELLGTIHVTFAICSANGRVLAAIDLDTDRANSRRVQQIKQSVLGACRVRYLRCPADHLPSIPELQLLVPQSAATTRGPQPAPTMPSSRGDAYSSSAPSRKRDRATLWQDSGFFQDSFFGVEGRVDSVMPGEFSAPRRGAGDREGPSGDVGGLAVDHPMRH